MSEKQLLQPRESKVPDPGQFIWVSLLQGHVRVSRASPCPFCDSHRVRALIWEEGLWRGRERGREGSGSHPEEVLRHSVAIHTPSYLLLIEDWCPHTGHRSFPNCIL